MGIEFGLYCPIQGYHAIYVVTMNRWYLSDILLLLNWFS